VTTPPSETFNVALSYIQEYLGLGATQTSARLQQPLDDAIIRAEAGAIADQAIKQVIVKIIPDASTGDGGSESVFWNLRTVQEYLRPPGDSGALQPQINGPMTRMGRDANTLKLTTAVIIEINPAT
jgi:hypothetical protein